MKKEGKYLISESHKNKLRQSAIGKEFKRLKNQLSKKSKAITTYKIVLAIMAVGVVSIFIVYFTQTKSVAIQTSKPTIQAISPSETTDTIENQPKPITKRAERLLYYTVYFDNATDFPLAQFTEIETAQEFSEQLQKMNLPHTNIVTDSIFRTNRNLPIDTLTDSYAVQLGAYSHDFLKEYKFNLIWMKYQYEDEYHKYRIGPFYGYSKSLQFASQLELKDLYILSYSGSKQ